MTRRDDKLLKIKAKLDEELGPNFNEMSQDELLRIVASNSFHVGRVLREIRFMLLIIGAAILLMVPKVLGWS